MSTLQIGVDSAKSVFEVAVSSVPGQVRERRRLTRTAFWTYFAGKAPAEVLLGACGSANHSGRQLQGLGHQVTLLHPRDVARYRDGDKTDRADAKALPIINEIGFQPLDRVEADLFFRLFSLRYERGSLLLTSKKNVRGWPEVFAGDEILTTAILDRLLHHVAVVHIDGQSFRLRELGALLTPTREAPRRPDGRPN